MRTLDRLFGALGAPAPALPVRGITSDSREVGRGTVFVAIRGRRQDGHRFIPEAVARGAVAVVGGLPEGEVAAAGDVPYLQVEDSRSALSRLAAEFYGHPSHALCIAGITGTKGKTTTSFLLHHLLESAGLPAGLLCSIGAWHGREAIIPRGHLTTPEAPIIQETLARWVARGIGHGVLETSSHALALHRVDDVAYDLALWTNLHPEHLDFHGDMESYFRVKATLVERAGFAILNSDCPYAMRLRHLPHLSYGIGRGDLRAVRVREGANSVSFVLRAPGLARGVGVRVPGIGAYNVANALASLAAVYHLGLPLEEAAGAVRRFGGVPGRMQVVRSQPVRVVVDYAHTTESLALALGALRRGTRGRLLLLMGAAGERDPRKRIPMGRIAATHADLVVFTEQDFRGEPLDAIIGALERGARAAGSRPGNGYVIIPDRRAAIRFILRHALPGDTVLLTGKGHERFLERGMERMPWDEVEEVRRWV